MKYERGTSIFFFKKVKTLLAKSPFLMKRYKPFLTPPLFSFVACEFEIRSALIGGERVKRKV